MNEFLKDDRRFLPCGGGSRLFLLADLFSGFMEGDAEIRRSGAGFGGAFRFAQRRKSASGRREMSVVGKKEEKNFASIWKVY